MTNHTSGESKKYRFAPKVYGRGIVPISREGWVIIVMIIAIALTLAPLILGNSDQPSAVRIITFIILILIIAILPMFALKSRMKGTLKWRWGVKDVDWK